MAELTLYGVYNASGSAWLRQRGAAVVRLGCCVVLLACGACPILAFLLRPSSLGLWPEDFVVINDVASDQSFEAIM